MKDALLIDMDYSHPARRLVCGQTMFGPDMSRCPCCSHWKPMQLSGFCSECSTRSGVNPLTLQAEAISLEDK